MPKTKPKPMVTGVAVIFNLLGQRLRSQYFCGFRGRTHAEVLCYRRGGASEQLERKQVKQVPNLKAQPTTRDSCMTRVT